MAGKTAGATVDVDVAELEVVDEAEGDGSGVCGVFGYAKRPGAAGRSRLNQEAMRRAIISRRR